MVLLLGVWRPRLNESYRCENAPYLHRIRAFRTDLRFVSGEDPWVGSHKSETIRQKTVAIANVLKSIWQIATGSAGQ